MPAILTAYALKAIEAVPVNVFVNGDRGRKGDIAEWH